MFTFTERLLILVGLMFSLMSISVLFGIVMAIRDNKKNTSDKDEPDA